MIVRNVEYIIGCDAPDCLTGWHALGASTREACAELAEKEGWLRSTRKRWLCPRCASAFRMPNVANAPDRETILGIFPVTKAVRP